jgi:hypothetical protein
MKEPLQSLAYSIFSICTKHSISIDIQWIPRKENTKADYISKMIDHEDWGVTYTIFEFIDDLWEPHSVDRFASVVNKKIVDLIPYFGIQALKQSMRLLKTGQEKPIS